MTDYRFKLLVDALIDVLALAVLGWLCYATRLDGSIAAPLIVATATSQTIGRVISTRTAARVAITGTSVPPSSPLGPMVALLAAFAGLAVVAFGGLS